MDCCRRSVGHYRPSRLNCIIRCSIVLDLLGVLSEIEDWHIDILIIIIIIIKRFFRDYFLILFYNLLIINANLLEKKLFLLSVIKVVNVTILSSEIVS